MHTVKAELTLAQADDLEEMLLEIANDLGKALNFSIFRLPTRAFITGYFKNREESLKQLRLIGLEKTAHHGFLRDRDWRDSVKKHFKPLVYRRVAWLPVWDKKFSKSKADTILKFDIGMAFGTGNHPTTRLCLRRLVELMGDESHTTNVLDIGCGSGILAITADKLGARAQGFDLDEHSIVVAKRNARLNRSKARFYVGDLYKDKLPQADIVFANLLANLIADNARKLWAAVKLGGVIVLSGLLKEELASTAKLFPCHAKLFRLGKWGALVIGKKQMAVGARAHDQGTTRP